MSLFFQPMISNTMKSTMHLKASLVFKIKAILMTIVDAYYGIYEFIP